MRRSATKRCLSCASRINRESRSCLFALNTRSKFYTDAVCFLFKRNLQPNCWQAFAPAGLTVCVNSPQHTSVLAVCRLCIQNTPSTGATHMSGFERNFSVSNCWASLSHRRVRYLNYFFLRLFCKFRQTRSDCWACVVAPTVSNERRPCWRQSAFTRFFVPPQFWAAMLFSLLCWTFSARFLWKQLPPTSQVYFYLCWFCARGHSLFQKFLRKWEKYSRNMKRYKVLNA